MNFFGHAVIASRRLPDHVADQTRFVLGAMLPDFVSMAGVRIEKVHDPVLAAGVELHHETDARFHSAAVFCDLCHWANEELQSAGVGRASARAVGHVGTELLLDGLLSHDREQRAAYGRAIEANSGESFEGLITLRGDTPPSQLRELLGRLGRAPLPEGYRDPAFVLERLRIILERRPRLALKPSDLAPTGAWLVKARDHLEENGTSWIDRLLDPSS